MGKRIPHFETQFKQLSSIVRVVLKYVSETMYMIKLYFDTLHNMIKYCSNRKRITQ